MRSTPLVNDCYYHIFNRGVDQRVIFQDENDYWRFTAGMFLFADEKFKNPGTKSWLQKDMLDSLLETERGRKPMVEVISYCLLPNHFHMLLRQLSDNGVERYLHKLGMAYARYFNHRYQRSGRLFENPYKSVLVDNDPQFYHLPRYIHLNILDLTGFRWRDGVVDDWEKAFRFMDEYRWSSHRVYNGFEQELPVVDEMKVREPYGAPSEYREYLKEWGGRNAAHDHPVVSKLLSVS